MAGVGGLVKIMLNLLRLKHFDILKKIFLKIITSGNFQKDL